MFGCSKGKPKGHSLFVLFVFLNERMVYFGFPCEDFRDSSSLHCSASHVSRPRAREYRARPKALGAGGFVLKLGLYFGVGMKFNKL